MNSYGSVSLVRQAIYKILHYMNFFPPPPPHNTTNNASDDDDVRITLPLTPSIAPSIAPSIEPKEKCTMCTILNISN